MARLVAGFVLAVLTTVHAQDRSLDAEVERYLEETGSVISMVHREDGLIQSLSADGNFAFHIRGRMLLDTMWERSPSFSTEGQLFFRQIRMGVDGHLLHNMVYALEISLASTGTVGLQDVFVGIRNLGALGTVQAGHQRRPFSLDGMTSILHHTFMERASPTRAFQLGRDSGLRLHNTVFDKRLAWTVGIFTLTDASGSGDRTDGDSFAFRVSGLPWRDLATDGRWHVGLSFDFERPGDGGAQFRTRPGPNGGPYYLDTGSFPADRDYRISVATALLLGPFAVQTEGFFVRVEGDGTNATFWGAYMQMSYWLTGEAERFNDLAQVPGRLRPLRDFHAGDHGGGAARIALRCDITDLTDGGIEGGEMLSLAFGLTWKSNPYVVVKLNLVYADVTNGPEGSGELYYLMLRFQYDF